MKSILLKFRFNHVVCMFSGFQVRVIVVKKKCVCQTSGNWLFACMCVPTPDTKSYFVTLRPRQNGCHFPEDIFRGIFLNEPRFVSKARINNIWQRPGRRPLSEPNVARLLTHICVTRSQWVKGASSIHYSHAVLFRVCAIHDIQVKHRLLSTHN